jgi:hypothetical protein
MHKEIVMRKNVVVLLGMFCLAFAVAAFPLAQDQAPPKEVNISGTWDMVTQTPNGDMPGEVTFAQEKETLKVSMSGPQGTPMTGVGTVKESAVQWSMTISGPDGGGFTLTFKGKIDGEKISGETQAGDFGTFTWVAAKKKK